MKTIFDVHVRENLILRINLLHEDNNKAQWGKMNIYQMVKHCILWEEMAQGKRIFKRTLLGRIFGKSVLPEFIGDESLFKKNVPTVPALKVSETHGNLEELKSGWVNSIEAYCDYKKAGFIHPFFGKMSKEQLGYLSYKHNDHHLRQFDV
jgi:hypothetical protein